MAGTDAPKKTDPAETATAQQTAAGLTIPVADFKTRLNVPRLKATLLKIQAVGGTLAKFTETTRDDDFFELVGHVANDSELLGIAVNLIYGREPETTHLSGDRQARAEAIKRGPFLQVIADAFPALFD